MPEDVYNILKRYEIIDNELLIAIVGATIGKVALLRKSKNENIILTENCAKIAIKGKSVLPEYLLVILQNSLVQKQIQLNCIQTTLPKLGLERLASLKIPPIPDLTVQSKIVTLFETAHASKKQKEAEAAELLASIDGYLLQELGITLPPVSEKKTYFITRSTQISGRRFDAETSNPIYDKIIETLKNNKKYNIVTLSNACDKVQRRFNADKETEYSYIQLGCIGRENSEVKEILKVKYPNIPSRAQQIVCTDEILFSLSNPHWGVHIVAPKELNNVVVSSGFNILQAKKEVSNSYFLVEILRTLIYRKLFEKYLTGAGLFLTISNKDLMSLPIPLPPLEKQTEIADHISNIRSRAKMLQQQASTEFETAKQIVEKMILGT